MLISTNTNTVNHGKFVPFFASCIYKVPKIIEVFLETVSNYYFFLVPRYQLPILKFPISILKDFFKLFVK